MDHPNKPLPNAATTLYLADSSTRQLANSPTRHHIRLRGTKLMLGWVLGEDEGANPFPTLESAPALERARRADEPETLATVLRDPVTYNIPSVMRTLGTKVDFTTYTTALTQRTNAPTHQRTNAPTHQRANTPTHQRTNAPTHQRTNTPAHQRTITILPLEHGGALGADVETRQTNY